MTLIALGFLGVVGARLGGAPMKRAAIRVLVGGAVAMGSAAIIGQLIGQAV
jgi:vacuolar iron transporter family protein